MSVYSQYNKQLTEIFEQLFSANQYYFQILIILILISLNYQVNGTNQKTPFGDKQGDRLLLFVLSLIFTIAVIIDWNMWHSLDQTTLFAAITLLLSLYIYQQHTNLNRYLDTFLSSALAHNSGQPSDVKETNIMDYVPDDIQGTLLEFKPDPFIKGGEYNKIDESDLETLPLVKYPNPGWNRLDQTIKDALDNNYDKKHFSPGKPSDKLVSRKGRNGGQGISSEWNLDRYYSTCNKQDLDKINMSCGGKCEGEPGSLHINQYCTNIPAANQESLAIISGNTLKQIGGRSEHIATFKKQYDIGGQGVLEHQKQGTEIIDELY